MRNLFFLRRSCQSKKSKMLLVLSVVAPIFGIILIGYGTAIGRWLPEGTAKGLSDFVFTVSMPALLFRTMVTVERTGLPAAGLVVAYYAATLAVLGASERLDAGGSAAVLGGCAFNLHRFVLCSHYRGSLTNFVDRRNVAAGVTRRC
jgi:hypothetical protein